METGLSGNNVQKNVCLNLYTLQWDKRVRAWAHLQVICSIFNSFSTCNSCILFIRVVCCVCVTLFFLLLLRAFDFSMILRCLSVRFLIAGSRYHHQKYVLLLSLVLFLTFSMQTNVKTLCMRCNQWDTISSRAFLNIFIRLFSSLLLLLLILEVLAEAKRMRLAPDRSGFAQGMNTQGRGKEKKRKKNVR